MKILKLPFQILGYKLFRHFGFPKLLPLNLALSITNRCDSKCKTCNIWKQPAKEELSTYEWKQILKSLGKVPIWFTITGGEPFLREDIDQIIYYICKYNKPLFLNIATNGLNPDKIQRKIERIIYFCQKNNVRLTVNVSMDEIGKRYDEVRGTNKGFDKVLYTINIIKEFKKQNERLNFGINIAVSRFNYKRFHTIYEYIQKNIMPDTIISEVAYNRKGFFNENEYISPDSKDYLKILDFLEKSQRSNKNTTAKIITSFRKDYYKVMKQNIINKKCMSCYALIASAEISPYGEIINCCTLADTIGNLKDNEYNFKKIWSSEKADVIRRKIKEKGCYCTSANIYYVNKLLGGFSNTSKKILK